MRILLYGGNWITNIGNAFLDYGCMAQLKLAFPEAEIINGSKFPQAVMLRKQKLLNREKSISSSGKIKSIIKKLISLEVDSSYMNNSIPYYLLNENLSSTDYIAIHGTCLGSSFLNIHYPVLKHVIDSGAKLLVIGGGMGEDTYGNNNDIEKVKEILSQLNPYLLISRDEETYDTFNDSFMNSYDGIDCAWFLDKYFIPANMSSKYIVLNFDQKQNPKLKFNHKIIRCHHDTWNYHSENAFWGSSVRQKIKTQFKQENTMISDLPEDYLNLYANAKETHSDRVHACVASLIYNTPAKLYSSSPRKQLFDKVGIKNIDTDLCEINHDYLKSLINKQMKYLKKILVK